MARIRKRGQASNLVLGYYGGLTRSRLNSYNESCTDELHPGPPYTRGGALFLTKSEVKWFPGHVILTEAFGGIGYDGGVVPNVPGWSGLDWSAEGSNPLDPQYYATHSSDGARGWSRFKPGKPSAGLGQALGEARKLPNIPRLREAVRSAKKAGGEFLNIEFGWKPLLNDVKQALKLAFTQEDALRKLKKENGHWVKKGGTISRQSDESEVVTGTDSGYPIFTSGHYWFGGTNPGKYRQSLFTRERRWFEASFRYWIPDLGTPSGDRRALRALYGLNVTPGLLWELTPWSWLVDWFSNVGDVIDNVSLNAADNLAARWAFNMTHVEHVRRCETTINLKQYSHPGPTIYREDISCSVERRRVAKLRSVANPFGFGLDYSALSAKQLMILAALGLSRS